ncbi:hypothetical protein [Lysobacter gummosus]|uniref:hypothetical protein n=1 Tax=Lysobacter gummosus TaxID=262324 RepID=UPI00363E8B2B
MRLLPRGTADDRDWRRAATIRPRPTNASISPRSAATTIRESRRRSTHRGPRPPRRCLDRKPDGPILRRPQPQRGTHMAKPPAFAGS